MARSAICCARALASGAFTTSVNVLEIDGALRCQANLNFGREDARYALIETLFRDAPALHGGEHGIDGGVGFGGHQQHVRARFEGAHGGFASAEAFRDAAHFKRVGDDDAFESQLLAQNAGQDFGRKRGGRVGIVKRGDGDVRGHHRIDAVLDGGAERHELHLLQPLAVAR